MTMSRVLGWQIDATNNLKYLHTRAATCCHMQYRVILSVANFVCKSGSLQRARLGRHAKTNREEVTVTGRERYLRCHSVPPDPREVLIAGESSSMSPQTASGPSPASCVIDVSTDCLRSVSTDSLSKANLSARDAALLFRFSSGEEHYRYCVRQLQAG